MCPLVVHRMSYDVPRVFRWTEEFESNPLILKSFSSSFWQIISSGIRSQETRQNQFLKKFPLKFLQFIAKKKNNPKQINK